MSNENGNLLRVPENRSLRFYYQPAYEKLPVQTQHGPLIENYLHRAHQTLFRALKAHPRTFAFRVDLRFPEAINLPSDFYTSNIAITLFIESLKEKLRYDRDQAKSNNVYAHDTKVRYIWTREQHEAGVPHYHLVIFLNADAYHTLGTFALDRQNLYNRVIASWGSALQIPFEHVPGLVHFPQTHNAEFPYSFLINVASPDYQKQLNQIFEAISYLCKYHTKTLGHSLHAFQTSHW